MELSYLKIWLALQLVIDFLFLLGIFWYLSRVRKDLEFRIFKSTSSKISENISPFLSDAEKTALKFDNQIKEKRKLIKELNETLDARISSINFLINRAENILNSSLNSVEKSPKDSPDSRDEKIIELYEQGLGNDEIAKSLGISVGEVAMIINLRKKFDALSSGGD